MSSPIESEEGELGSLKLRLILVGVGVTLLGLRYAAEGLYPDSRDVHALLSFTGLLIAGLPVFKDSLLSMKADGFEATKYYMDQFVALALLGCLVTGKHATGTFVAAILIVGQMLEEHSSLGAREAVGSLLKLTRAKARRQNGSAWEEVESSELVTGDRIQLLPGDLIPADATIVEGHTSVDQASITGESLPVDASPGTDLYAGTVNLTGAVVAKVNKIGTDTVLGQVSRIVDEAKRSKAPLMRLIDDYTRFYMPVVLLLAGFVLFFTRDAERAISVIIVAMPCAFVLASPAAMVAALAVASRMGVLVKSPKSFEVAKQLTSVAFDKTGTVTTGRLAVEQVRPAPGFDESAVLSKAASVEAASRHPMARAVVTEARRRSIPIEEKAEVVEVHGLGARTDRVIVGRRRWLEALGIPVPEVDPEELSAVHVAEEGRYVGSVFCRDTLRPEASAVVEQLRNLGISRVSLLTGDRRAVAEPIGARLGVDEVQSDCLPADKKSSVERAKAANEVVLVVGDGVNDAPALAVADLSVAMGALGSDVAIKTADVALMGNHLGTLPRFLALSAQTYRVINQNLGWGLLFIIGFVVLSAGGFVNPIVAAILHEFSAFFVILNSARLLRFDERVKANTQQFEFERAQTSEIALP